LGHKKLILLQIQVQDTKAGYMQRNKYCLKRLAWISCCGHKFRLLKSRQTWRCYRLTYNFVWNC